MKAMFLAAIGAALAPPLLAQATDCNNTYKSPLSHPGYQPGSEINTPCGQTSVTISVSISASGVIKIVDAGASGSVSVTIQTPSSCPSQKLWIAEDLHSCGQPLEGWHCNPEGRQIPIKLYGSDDPCPEIPTGAALMELLAKAAAAGSLGGLPISIPCNNLQDITATLPKGARFRWTAKAEKCSDKEKKKPETEFVVYESGAGGGTVYGLFGDTVQGDPSEFDFDALVAEEGTVSGLVTISGLDALAELLEAVPASEDHPIVAEIRSSSIPVEWIDGLSIDVASGLKLSNGLWATHRSSMTGNFRADGNFDLSQPGVIQPEDEEKSPVSYTHFFSRRSGTVFSMLDGSDSAMVHPAGNNAATLVMQGPLSGLTPVLQWLDNPYGLLPSSYADHVVTELSENRVSVIQTTPVTFAEGVAPTEVDEALFGHGWKYVVDTSSDARVISAERFHVQSGVVLQAITFGSYVQVAPLIWRPMAISMEEFDSTGELVSRYSCALRGGRRAGQEPVSLSLVNPAENTWYVRAN